MSGHRTRLTCDASCRAQRVRRCTASCRAHKDLLFNDASGGQPMFKKTLATVRVATLAAAAPAAVSAADTRNVSVQLAKCNPCAGKRGCNPGPAKNACNPCAAKQGWCAARRTTLPDRQRWWTCTGVFLWRKLSARSASSVISRLPKTLIAELPTLKWTLLVFGLQALSFAILGFGESEAAL